MLPFPVSQARGTWEAIRNTVQVSCDGQEPVVQTADVGEVSDKCTNTFCKGELIERIPS